MRRQRQWWQSLWLTARERAPGLLQRMHPDCTPQTKFGGRIMALATPERMGLSRNRAFLDFLDVTTQPALSG